VSKLTDAEMVEALFKIRDVWRYANENKSVDCYPRPLVALVDALEREMERLGDEAVRREKLFCAALLNACDTDTVQRVLTKYNEMRENQDEVLAQLGHQAGEALGRG